MVSSKSMDNPTKIHLGIGLLLVIVSGFALFTGCQGLVSGIIILLTNIYLVAILVEAALRAGEKRTIKGDVLLAKPEQCFAFPSKAWSLVLILFLITSSIFGFANMYLQKNEIVYVGPTVTVEKVKTNNKVSSSPPRIMKGEMEALYYSIVTMTTLGYGDFVPASAATRMLVMWQLGTGLLLLLGIFPLVVARIADF